MTTDSGQGTASDPPAGPRMHDEPLDQLFARLSPMIYATLRRHTRLAGNDLDDVVQDVWLMLIENLDRIREPAAIPGWLRTTASRHAIRVANRLQREFPTELATTEARCPSVTPEDQVARQARDAVLRRAVNRLPDRDRKLIALIARGLGYSDIALRLGVSRDSVGQLRTRCLKRLRRRLEADGITDAGV